MPESGNKTVGELLTAAEGGEPRAAQQLLPLLYDELRELARQRLARELPGQTLQPTGLVHEAYLRLTHGTQVSWNGKRHFFGAAAEAMRRILIERARRVGGPKRGGDWQRAPLSDNLPEPGDTVEPDWLAVDQALRGLEQEDPGLAEIVKLRYFAGLSVDETASALGVSPSTVDRSWRVARAWLADRMTGDADGGE